jgi:hypothetical protein
MVRNASHRGSGKLLDAVRLVYGMVCIAAKPTDHTKNAHDPIHAFRFISSLIAMAVPFHLFD